LTSSQGGLTRHASRHVPAGYTPATICGPGMSANERSRMARQPIRSGLNRCRANRRGRMSPK
jgi:hypothetical protein